MSMYICIYMQTYSQTDSSLELNEVIVTGIKDSKPKQTSLNIEPYKLKDLEIKSPLNLSDALAKLPGISQISTGNAISKPVIRGLYGNRILIVLSGLRFDNQQWQDEHGLGLSQIGIDRIEVIKGPASILYGTDALGGVINIVEEKPTEYKTVTDINTRFFSNTLGTLTDIGISTRNKKNWKRLRIGYENHADYTDGKNTRVLNSRNKGYYVKAGFGKEKKNWKQENSYNFSYNQYGFILDDLGSFFSPDARLSRKMNGPHHNVILNIANSQNTIVLAKSILKVNAGIQSNVRMEDEGGGQISLNMHLFSLLENVRWEKNFKKDFMLVLNHQFTFENNTNYGGRIIIPDADLFEGNMSVFTKYSRKKMIVELGLGGNIKKITTKTTRGINTPGGEIKPFTINKPSVSGLLGFSYFPTERLNIKSNIATGYRAANLAELSANGLHEGVFRYEVGSPNLKVEQNVTSDITLEYKYKRFFIYGSLYFNQFFNYIYLAPTSEQFYGFQVFRYKQQNATIKGGEVVIQYHPTWIKNTYLKMAYSNTYGVLSDGKFLPFIPTNKISSSVKYELKHLESKKYIECEYIYNFKQNRPATFELSSPDYNLVNIYIGWQTKLRKKDFQISFNCNNVLNVTYADHLSRLRYYGMNNMGRNFVLSFKYIL